MENGNRLKRLRRTVIANVGIALGSLFAYPITGSRVLSGEAAHSGSDALLHGMRYAAEKTGINQESRTFQLFLKASLLIPAGFLTWNAWKAGIDVTNGVKISREPTDMIVNSIGAVSIAGVNGYAYTQTKQITEHSHASLTSHKHQTADMWVSGGFAGSLGAEVAGVPYASSVGAMVFSAVAAMHLFKEVLHSHEH